ncbi:MAG: chitosanase [Pyrinomonadaceae bacterium]
MQEVFSFMKHTAFSLEDQLKTLAIINIYETGKPFGDFAACVVLNDGAGISYGINQFTHRSGSLATVVERYLARGGETGRKILADALPLLRRSEPVIVRATSQNEVLKKALRAAAVTSEMREAQLHVAYERYLKPAIDACAGSDFILPLSLAVIYDSKTHGSYEKIRDRVGGVASNLQLGNIPERHSLSAHRTAEPRSNFEKAWITEYVRRRDAWLAGIPRLNATRYRTRFFLNQITLGKWHLELPLNINGFRLEENHIQNLLAYADGFLDLAVGPHLEPQENLTTDEPSSTTPQIPATNPQAQPPNVRVSSPHVSNGSLVTHGANFDAPAARTDRNPESWTLNKIEKHVDAAAEKFDQGERIITTVITRTDRAKSLWTTVIGTLWQTAWAIIGVIAGLPREVWFAVAIIAAALMLLYLYRQIALGLLRERGHSCPHEHNAFENVEGARTLLSSRTQRVRKY